MAAAGEPRFIERYKAAIDTIVDSHDITDVPSADNPGWMEEVAQMDQKDRFDVTALRCVRYHLMLAMREGKCLYCWVLKEACYCDRIPQIPVPFRWHVFYHHQEFLRVSSTGKLVCKVLGGQLLVSGVHKKELEEVVQHPNTFVLFPDSSAVTYPDVRGMLPRPPAGGASGGSSPYPDINVIVLDGTWGQARTLYKMIRAINPAVKTIRLDLETASQHESLFNTLRKQSEVGRVCTFEASALLLAEAVSYEGGDTTIISRLVDTLKFMVDMVANEKHRKAPFGNLTEEQMKASIAGHLRRHHEESGKSRMQRTGINRHTDVELESWVERLMEYSRVAPLPPPVSRYCPLCKFFMSGQRLIEHVQGRKHCMKIARAHLGRGEKHRFTVSYKQPLDLDKEEVERVYREHSCDEMYRLVADGMTDTITKARHYVREGTDT